MPLTPLKTAAGYFINASEGDVRASSSDSRYANQPFTGTIAQALRQARAAPEHPIPYRAEARKAGVSLDRYELLVFLRVLP